jgi:hypothetical protein
MNPQNQLNPNLSNDLNNQGFSAPTLPPISTQPAFDYNNQQQTFDTSFAPPQLGQPITNPINNNTPFDPYSTNQAPDPSNFHPYNSNISAGNNFDQQVGMNPQINNQQFNPNSNQNSNSNLSTNFDPQFANNNGSSTMPMQDIYNQSNPIGQPNQFMDPNFNQGYPDPSYNEEYDPIPQEPIMKPKSSTKKILIFGLIGLIAILLVASVSLFFLSNNNKAPTAENQDKTTQSPNEKKLTQDKPAQDTGDQPADTKSSTTTTKPITGDFAPDTSTPAGRSVVNQGATKSTKEWLTKNFKETKSVDASGVCKTISVCGDKFDPDTDGLTNLEEYVYGTNPNKEDSDDDGLSDGDEIKIYYSAPLALDSDGDTYKDSDEINSCYDSIKIAKTKIDKVRLNQIASLTTQYPVHKITKATLEKAGANAEDLEKGYISSKCVGSPATAPAE